MQERLGLGVIPGVGWRATEDGGLDLELPRHALHAERLPPLLNENTKLVQVSLVSFYNGNRIVWPALIVSSELAGMKKFTEAAKEYEEALKLFPDNKDAKDALKRAKDGKP